jgi:segregation and condensation protein B
MEPQDIKKILESFFFITEQPVTLKMLEGFFDKEVSKEQLQALAQELVAEYAARGSAVELREVAGGWQMATRPEFGPWIRKLFKDRLTYRLSQSAMETLTIVAYKQPITRGEIEEVRGVEVNAVLDTLVDRKLVRIAGRKETIGRPLLYGTTTEFLRAFGLRRLEDLPALESLTPPSTEAVAEASAKASAVESETTEPVTNGHPAELELSAAAPGDIVSNDGSSSPTPDSQN